MEGTRHYGLGLARYLAGAGRQVSEIGSTRHVGKRRAGKSDAIDAVRAARELLARPRPAQMCADGDREALRLLMVDRDNAVQSCKTARAALAWVLVTAPAPLRERLRPLLRARADPRRAAPAGPDRAKEEAASVALSRSVMTGLPWCRTRWKDRRRDAHRPDSDSRAPAGPAGPASRDYRRSGCHHPWPCSLHW